MNGIPVINVETCETIPISWTSYAFAEQSMAKPVCLQAKTSE